MTIKTKNPNSDHSFTYTGCMKILYLLVKAIICTYIQICWKHITFILSNKYSYMNLTHYLIQNILFVFFSFYDPMLCSLHYLEKNKHGECIQFLFFNITL